MALRDRAERHPEKIVFRDYIVHVQAIVKTLHAVCRRTPALVLNGQDTLAA